MAEIKTCPFCGKLPVIEPWHGGKPTKQMISCENVYCHVNPSVTGETEDETISLWNTRID